MNQEKRPIQGSNRPGKFKVTIQLGAVFVLVTFFWGYFANQWNSRIDRSIALFELSAGTTELIRARQAIFGDFNNLFEDFKEKGKKLKIEDLGAHVAESMQNEEFRNNSTELLKITNAVANCSNSKLCDQFVSCKLFFNDAMYFWSASKGFYQRTQGIGREIQNFIDDCLEYMQLERDGKEFRLFSVRLFPILSDLNSILLKEKIARGDS